MSRYNPIKNSFVAGELSPRLEARDDLEQYFQGLRQSMNGIVLPHGGFLRRSGSVFVSEVKDSSAAAELIPFIVSTDQAYVCEFGDEYVRFYTNEGRLESGGSPVEVASPYAEADLPLIKRAQESDVMYLVHPDYYVYKLSRTSATTFTLAKVEFVDGKAPLQPANLDTANTVTVTGSGPYTLTWAAGVSLTTAADVGRAVRIDDGGTNIWFEITSVTSSLIAVADKKSAGTPSISGEDDWALGLFSNTEGCYSVEFHEGRLAFGGFPNSGNKDRFVLSVSDDFENFELEDPSADDAANADKSISRRTSSGQANTIFWLESAGEQLVIGTSGAEFRATGSNDDLMTPAGTKVRQSTERGSSSSTQPVVIDDQVIFLQRNTRKLRRFEGAINAEGGVSFRSSDISVLAEHILNEGAKKLRYQQDPDSVIWATKTGGEMIGFTIEPQQKVVGAHRHRAAGSFGSGIAVIESVAVIPNPEETEDQLWWIVKRTIDGATVRYVEYLEDQFRPDVTVASTTLELIDALYEARFVDSHVVYEPKTDISGASQAGPVVISSPGHGLSNGDLVEIRDVVGMTELNRNVYKAANVTAGTFELTDAETGDDVDGTGFTAYESGGVARKGVTSVSGADHLEGETVQVFSNGAVHPDKVVTSGAVALDRVTFRAVVGLGYDTIFETQRFIGGGRIGTDQGQKARNQRVVARMHNTVGGRFGRGPAPRNLEAPLFRGGTDPMDSSPPLFTGDKGIPLPGGWEDENTVYYKQDQPLPSTILALMPRSESNER